MEYCLESVERYSEGKIHKSEPEPRNSNVSTTGTYFYSSGEIFDYKVYQQATGAMILLVYVGSI